MHYEKIAGIVKFIGEYTETRGFKILHQQIVVDDAFEDEGREMRGISCDLLSIRLNISHWHSETSRIQRSAPCLEFRLVGCCVEKLEQNYIGISIQSREGSELPEPTTTKRKRPRTTGPTWN